MMDKYVKVKKEDWKYIQAALVTYKVESFQSHNLQTKITEIIEKYA